MRRVHLFALLSFLFAWPSLAQQAEPIIDVHLHAHPIWSTSGMGADTTWWPKQFRRPETEEQLKNETMRTLKELNIVTAVLSGHPERAAAWAGSDRKRFLIGYELFTPDDPPDAELATLRKLITAGEIDVLAEVAVQYAGIAPNDPRLEPYFALAEELDVPVGIHLGLGPPGATHIGFPSFRMALGDPLLLEPVLARHPKLRLYVMHAGWPMLDRMVALMYAFPNVYVDTGVIDWYIPNAEFHPYLKRLVDAGFGRRIMFGSDQMQWPESIRAAVAAIESAPFLTAAQKRDILYNNAARFFAAELKGRQR